MKKSLFVGIAAALTLTACSKVTLENYEQLEVGMDRAEVEALLGSPSACEEKTLHTNCVWGSDSKNIQVTLVSDKVTLYSEKGL
ncbi:outer membrane protein assembly factor BamE domain-containing protein [Pseudoalteromonas pernae]|uniref:outer membrane protein assembly factor BamE domain-containing protein n=1 Tax=Pseudoalteromonas pernae TaxID=3118054 RepID=UPI003242D669